VEVTTQRHGAVESKWMVTSWFKRLLDRRFPTVSVGEDLEGTPQCCDIRVQIYNEGRSTIDSAVIIAGPRLP